jgi:hypothetical protein
MSAVDPGNQAVLVGVARALGLKDASALADLRPSGLMKLTQRELLDIARELGLTKVSRLNKEALLARVWEALDLGSVQVISASPAAAPPARGPASTSPSPSPSGPAPVAARPAAPVPAPPASIGDTVSVPAPSGAPESAPGVARKFDVGEGAEQDLARVRAEAQKTIPWGYGSDRVTALPVDPDRLCVYWEVTDDSIARARQGLGPGGPGAWLALRVYDVTGRIFDGQNAHSYFDHDLGGNRDVRQWFFHIGKPTSQAIVDVGMKSHEGYFVKIARSGRVEFPRNEPVAWGEPEWMTVQVSTGHIEGEGARGRFGWSPGVAAPPPGGGHLEDPGAHGGGDWHQVDQNGQPGGLRRRLWAGRFSEGRDLETSWEERTEWEEWGEIVDLDPAIIRTLSWEGQTEISSWSAGPFEYPVELPATIRESYSAASRVVRTGGRTHLLLGPWEVVIKGISPHAEHQVLSRWEVFRSWTTAAWREIVTSTTAPSRPFAAADRVAPGGASEGRLGASERWGRSGSELRLGGASERFRVGASELRLGGASERRFAGASQWVARGASERRFAGASEWQYLGASELRLGGASERRLGGASEFRLGGGSEGRLGGGSEGRLLSPEVPFVAPEPRPEGGGQPASSWPIVDPVTPPPRT